MKTVYLLSGVTASAEQIVAGVYTDEAAAEAAAKKFKCRYYHFMVLDVPMDPPDSVIAEFVGD